MYVFICISVVYIRVFVFRRATKESITYVRTIYENDLVLDS